ncbi:hypothetical protein F5876DRAFT_67216 [Lentinula aff. lateritia]|uniref:Uncharacterized protein n=1 Tax=Lentinula aff. lateritia TaxID=2804960 RepID=A0ACC1TVZ2_9AGAR|nr:hypothetical protein F5876DRAFT_67216 [Lentinula aff. lateritia]
MSNVNDITSSEATRPSHHVHGSEDPLPGAKRGGVNAIDYSAETMERTPSTWNEGTERKFAQDHPEIMGAQPEHGQTQTHREHHHNHHHEHHDRPQEGRNAFSEQRPMDVHPTSAGGVAVDGNSDLPEGKATVMDKVVGKTQKIIGKATHKPEMHEKGELRETGGKAAARGEARALHD